MKNVSKIIALLGMVAMLFAMVGCSTGNSPDEKGPGTEINPETKEYDKYWKPDITTSENDAPVGYFSIWADNNWCGSKVTLENMVAQKNMVTLTQTVTGSCWYGTQIWYGVEGTRDLTFAVNSTVAGDITVNGVVYTLEANTPKPIELTGFSGTLKIQLGAKEANTQLGNCTFVITGLFEPVTE